jgi:intracellular sulfur oxidation DsrE/DsrF family protein
MKERNVSKEQIIPEAGFVKAGILEIVIKQEEGWSYIKSGF